MPSTSQSKTPAFRPASSGLSVSQEHIRMSWTKLALAVLLTFASITIVIPPNAAHNPAGAATDMDSAALKDAYVADHTVARAAIGGTVGLVMLLVTYTLPFHKSSSSWTSRLARIRSQALGFYHPQLVTPLYLALTTSEVVAALTCLCGVGLRQWAFRTLADKFTYAVTIVPGHELVTSGPYARLMHPGYTGLLLAMAGLFWYMGFRGWRFVALVGMYLGPLVVRMRDEERVMREYFGDDRWAEYVRGRERLVPFLW